MKNQGKTVHNVQLIFRGSNEESLWFQSSLNFFHTKQKSDYKCISFLDMQNMYIFFFKIAQISPWLMQGEIIIFCIFLVDLFQFVFLKKSKKKANTWYKKWPQISWEMVCWNVQYRPKKYFDFIFANKVLLYIYI